MSELRELALHVCNLQLELCCKESKGNVPGFVRLAELQKVWS
jgi:hypothetical protein